MDKYVQCPLCRAVPPDNVLTVEKWRWVANHIKEEHNGKTDKELLRDMVVDFLNRLLPYLEWEPYEDANALVERLTEVTKICSEFAREVKKQLR